MDGPAARDEPVTGSGDGVAASPSHLDTLAQELEEARFTVAFRGFEPKEVQELLHRAASVLRASRSSEEDAGGGAPAVTQPRSPRIVRVEAEAQEILRAARSAADELLAAARAEGRDIVAAAEREQARVRAEAEAARAEARTAVLDAVRQATQILARARSEAQVSPTPPG